MAEQADVYVKNDLTGAIGAVRYLVGGGSDLDITIASGIKEKIFLPEPGVLLAITPPNGNGTEGYSFDVTADESIISWSTESSRWTVEIIDNSVPPEVPTTVNITVGTDGP